MQKYDIHVCLISGQAAPNLLPILDSNFKPKQAIFITTNKMKEKAGYLKKVFEKKNIKVSIEDLKDEFNFSEMENEIFTILDKYDEENIALNVTGGTKLMAIAAQNAFIAAGKPIFYVDTDNNRIVFVFKDKNDKEDHTLNTVVDIETYLSSYGVKIINTHKPNNNQKWKALAHNFIHNRHQYEKIIPKINYLTSVSEEKDTYRIDENLEVKNINNFLVDLDVQNIIDFCYGEVDFRNRETRDFLKGGWLEDYVYFQLIELKNRNKIQDIQCNLEIANEKFEPTKKISDNKNVGNNNELDIAFIANNKLHIIECKTQNMEEDVSDILYKLETIKDYGGIMTKKCLVSYLNIDPKISKSIENRAKALNIKIIQGKDLQRLTQIIQDWISR